MRSLPLTLSAWLLLTLAGSVSAQTILYQAVVTQGGAEVRAIAGDSPASFTTNVLRPGEVVQVTQDLGNGWLGILPPPGSFSWINDRDVEMNRFPSYPDRLVIGHQGGGKYSVFMGSEVNAGSRGTVLGVQLEAGSQYNKIARAAVKDHEGNWIAIEAPHTEVRYIRAEKVQKSVPGSMVQGPVQTIPTVNYGQPNAFPAGAGQASLPPPASNMLAPRAPPSEAERLWQRAQQAERMGNVAEAIQLYSQLASQSTGYNQDLAMQGLNRAYWLKEAQRNTVVSTIPPLQSRSVPATTASEVRYSNGPPARDASRSAVQLAPPTTGTPGSQQPASSFTPTASSASPWQAVTPEGYRGSGPGRLRRAGRFLENRKTYVLESSQNYPRLYVTPNTGVDLEPFVDRDVELFGPAIYRGDLRANYMTVVRVQPLP